MNKALLVDTNFSAYPIYVYLKNIGYDVYTIGAKASDVLALKSEHYINRDYSNVDEILHAVKQYDIITAVPGCNDISYLATSKANIQQTLCNIDNPENAYNLFLKDNFRKLCTKLHLPSPKLFDIENTPKNIDLIVKPIDSFSGKGVTKISSDNFFELNKAYNNAKSISNTNKAIIEQYVRGQLYSHSAFLRSYKVIFDVVVEEHCTTNQFTVDTSYVRDNFSHKLLRQLRDAIETLASHLSLSDGLIHTQFITNGTDIWLIEVTRRCPGDLYNKLIETSIGYPYTENYVRTFLNLPLCEPTSSKRRYIIRHTISTNQSFEFQSIVFQKKIKLCSWTPVMKAGEKTKSNESARLAVVFFEVESASSLNEALILIKEKKLYKIQAI